MTLYELFLLSIALGIDVLGVSFAYGLITQKQRFYQMFRLAGACGIAQGIMPIFGYVATVPFAHFIGDYNYIIVFGIFVLLGAHIIYETLNADEEEQETVKELNWKTLFILSIATSIDALVSGSMIYMTKTPLISASIIIASGSFLLSIIGFNLKFILHKVPEKYLQIVAGFVLIALGFKNLIAHFI